MIRNRFSQTFIFVILQGMIILFCSHPLNGQDDETNLISISIKKVQLEKVLQILSAKSGIVFISDPTVRQRLISLDLKDVKPLEALSILTELFDLGFQQLGESGKYVVADRSEIEIRTQLGSYHCEFADAENLSKVLAQMVTGGGVGKVFADKRTNTVIFQDTPAKLIALKNLILKLDKPTRQVYIKSAIIEISITDESERGVHWFTQLNNISNQGGEIVAATDFVSMGELPTKIGFPSVSGGLGVGIFNFGIDVAIAALRKTSDLNLLSTPFLITLDNQSAEIEVGDQIPYPKLNEFGVTSYEFKDATIRLKLRPHINNDSTITIYIEPQANFQQGFTPDNIPIIAKRSAKTQVVVRNGQTVILGGLMRESEVETIVMVPLIGSIPLIGALFKSTKKTKLKTELIILITPIILNIDTWMNTPDLQKLLPSEKIMDKLN